MSAIEDSFGLFRVALEQLAEQSQKQANLLRLAVARAGQIRGSVRAN